MFWGDGLLGLFLSFLLGAAAAEVFLCLISRRLIVRSVPFLLYLIWLLLCTLDRGGALSAGSALLLWLLAPGYAAAAAVSIPIILGLFLGCGLSLLYQARQKRG